MRRIHFTSSERARGNGQKSIVIKWVALGELVTWRDTQRHRMSDAPHVPSELLVIAEVPKTIFPNSSVGILRQGSTKIQFVNVAWLRPLKRSE